MAKKIIDTLQFQEDGDVHVFTLPYGTCSTAAATAAKTVAVQGNNFSLETGSRVLVKFTVANTASSPTLNVSSTGAKAIYYRGSAISANYLAANRTYEFVYNGTQWDLVGDIDSINVAYGVCSTAAATAAKTVTVADTFQLVEGAMVAVKFTYANSASSPTLNVNGTGAKPMCRYGTTALSTSTTTTGWYAGSIQIFIYDGTSWIRDYWNNSTYSNAGLGQGYGTCSTAAATTAKVVSLSSYSLTTGGVVAVKFTYAVPASATMNINSKGAKNIFYKGAAITAGIISAGDIATFIYDGTQYHLLAVDKSCSDRLFTTLVPTGTSIPADADLATTEYLKVGRYYCSSNANAKTINNCPSAMAFMMEVYSPLSTTIDNETTATYVYRIRKLTTYSPGLVFIQYVSSGATAGTFTYGDWQLQTPEYVSFASGTNSAGTTINNGATLTKGSSTNPVYVDSTGHIKACSYTLGMSVPSTAKLTDTTYSAGDGISLSGTTFSNSGVRSIATGSTNGTISVNTNGTSAEVAVKGLGSAAYTDSTAYLKLTNSGMPNITTAAQYLGTWQSTTANECALRIGGKSNGVVGFGINNDGDPAVEISTNWYPIVYLPESDYSVLYTDENNNILPVSSDGEDATYGANWVFKSSSSKGSYIEFAPSGTGILGVLGFDSAGNPGVLIANSSGFTHRTFAMEGDIYNDLIDTPLPVAMGGTGVDSHTDTTYTTARYRASALTSTATDPTVNGVINWWYE